MMDIFSNSKSRNTQRLNEYYNSINQTNDKPFSLFPINTITTPIKGHIYKVPCIVKEVDWFINEMDEQEIWMDLDHKLSPTYHKKVEYVPVLDHPHSDLENGQKEIHYHIDDRFRGSSYQGHLPSYYQEGFSTSDSVRPQLKEGYKFEYLALVCTNRYVRSTTPVTLIRKSKLKHKCIHKGKCPHRGYDLSNIPSDNGIITCPLHGLQFNAFDKKLLIDPSDWKDLKYFDAHEKYKQNINELKLERK